ncbi:MAG: transposase [Candidatus Omnitrophica bacterium]|nr:transposase [Candidatus Omnitrophota bacterium]
MEYQKLKEEQKMKGMPRIHIEGGVYYVTVRGDHDEKIFREAEDYQSYLNLLRKYKEQYGFKLFAFVLLPNHLCLLIELREGVVLSDIMHDLNGNYTKYFNKKYSLKGHLFRETYRMNLLEKSRYLVSMSAYIHLYPQRLNLTPHPAAYPYSSYPVYLYYAGFEDACMETKSSVFGFDPGMEQEIAGVLTTIKERNYTDYLRNISIEEIKILALDLKKGMVLGSEEFRETVKSKIKAYWQEKYRQELAFLQQRLNDLEMEEGVRGWEEELR